MKTTYELELMRHDVTPAQFLAYVRSSCKRHGITFEMDSRYFAEGESVNGNYWNTSYNGGTPKTRPCIAETVKALPYDHQTYIHNFDGSVYNEIVEFEFDDDKTGHGYFYTVQRDADSDADARDSAEACARYHEIATKRNAFRIDRLRRAHAETVRNIENGWAGDYAQGHADMIAREIEMLERENAEHAEAIAEMRTTETTDKNEEEKPMKEKKLGKFERDEMTVNAILGNGAENLTTADRLNLLAIYQTSYHDSGKIDGITSCDSSCHGCTFCAMMRKAAESDPSIICGKCYDAKQEEYRTNVPNRHALNLRIMSTVLFTVEELATLPTTAITRINSSGDIENETHARNMIRFAVAHPYSHVTLWAKNYAAVEKAFDAEGKPENMLYIASSYRIDKPVTLPKYADFTFTVYSTKEKVLEAMARGAGECNGKKCRECGYKCYLGGWSHGQDIAELLRK